MFKLVGDESFTIGAQQTKCELRVDPMPYFSFGYSLYVDGKPLQKFTEKQALTLRSWAVVTHGKRYRVVFGGYKKTKRNTDLYLMFCNSRKTYSKCVGQWKIGGGGEQFYR